MSRANLNLIQFNVIASIFMSSYFSFLLRHHNQKKIIFEAFKVHPRLLNFCHKQNAFPVRRVGRVPQRNGKLGTKEEENKKIKFYFRLLFSVCQYYTLLAYFPFKRSPLTSASIICSRYVVHPPMSTARPTPNSVFIQNTYMHIRTHIHGIYLYDESLPLFPPFLCCNPFQLENAFRFNAN